MLGDHALLTSIKDCNEFISRANNYLTLVDCVIERNERDRITSVFGMPTYKGRGQERPRAQESAKAPLIHDL